MSKLWGKAGGRDPKTGQFLPGSGARGVFGAMATKKLGTFGGVSRGLAVASGAIGAPLGVAIRDALKFDDALTSLKISSRGAMGSLERMRSKFLAVSKETGVAKEDLVEGSAAFVALTGDGKAASDMMELFAKVAKGGNVEMADIAGTAASMIQQLHVAPADMEKTFSILTAGAKAGAVEFKDMAGLMASLTAGFRNFDKSTGVTGVAELGSAFQIAMKAFGSPAEAATGLESLFTSITRNAAKLKKIGVDPYFKDAKGIKHLKAFHEIVLQLGAQLASGKIDATKMIEVLGRQEAVKTLTELARENGKAWIEVGQATTTANDISEDYAARQASSSAIVAKAWNDVKVAVAEAFTPDRVAAFAMMLTAAVEKAGQLVGFLQYIAQGDDAQIKKDERDNALDDMILKGHKVSELADPKNAASDDVWGAENAFIDKRPIMEAAQRRMRKNAAVKKQDDERARKAAGVVDPRYGMPTFRFDEKPSAASLDTTINVTVPPGSDANGIAMTIKGVMQQLLRNEYRHAIASGGSE